MFFLSHKISFSWVTLFICNVCASLHFFSLFSLIDRVCGYLPFVPFTNILAQIFAKPPRLLKSYIYMTLKRRLEIRGKQCSVTDSSYLQKPIHTKNIYKLFYCDSNLQLRQYRPWKQECEWGCVHFNVTRWSSVAFLPVSGCLSTPQLSVLWGSVSYVCWYKMFFLWSCHPGANTLSCLQWNVLRVHLHLLSVFSITLRDAHTV